MRPKDDVYMMVSVSYRLLLPLARCDNRVMLVPMKFIQDGKTLKKCNNLYWVYRTKAIRKQEPN